MKEREKKNKKRIINYFLIIAIISMMMVATIEEYRDGKVPKEEKTENMAYSTQELSSLYQLEKEEEPIKEYPKEEIEKQYKGYTVLAKLQIPAINLETYILEQYSKNTLNTSVTKFWGANPNQIGNFCIAGHNFQNKNMFHNLRNLEIGNNLYISDFNIGKVEYEIYDIYVVEPEDVKCLSQETEGKREATLITCTSDSKKRIIVKAREK